MDVLRPKPLETHPGDEIVTWARRQLAIARSILDNPGGGLLFATQTIGQVRSALAEADADRWRPALTLLADAEDRAIRRDYAVARDLLRQARQQIDQG